MILMQAYTFHSRLSMQGDPVYKNPAARGGGIRSQFAYRHFTGITPHRAMTLSIISLAQNSAGTALSG